MSTERVAPTMPKRSWRRMRSAHGWYQVGDPDPEATSEFHRGGAKAVEALKRRRAASRGENENGAAVGFGLDSRGRDFNLPDHDDARDTTRQAATGAGGGAGNTGPSHPTPQAPELRAEGAAVTIRAVMAGAYERTPDGRLRLGCV